MALAALVLFLRDPAHSHLFPSCPVLAATGLYCPGCGSLRAIHQLLHGHLGAAFRLNPVAIALLPLVVLAMALEFIPHLNQKYGSAAASGRSIWILFLVLVAYGVLRNLPFEPFARLAPH